MKVCIVPYGDTWTHQGGHKTQQLRTAAALWRTGVHVVIGGAGLATTQPFDVVHFFGDPTELTRLGRPRGRLVVSPVYFPATVRLGPVRRRVGRGASIVNRLYHGLSRVRHPKLRASQWERFRDSLRAIATADLLVVNSVAEGRLLSDDLGRYTTGTPVPPVAVVHSGVEPVFFGGSAERGRALVGHGAFVLCVGRPEPIKNQLALSHAMRGVPRRLVLVGEVLPGNGAFLDACRHALPSLVHIPNLSPGQLADVYAAADVHVLASHYETTGLSTAEALAAGTPVVIGRGPCVEEYFADCARVVDPDSPKEIRAAILAAIDAPMGCESETAKRYSWDRTAQELLVAYGG
jgi:glycosyltransferase involved in cell wall biosynthesis